MAATDGTERRLRLRVRPPAGREPSREADVFVTERRRLRRRLKIVHAGLGRRDRAVELGERVRPRARIAQVDAEWREELLRRARAARGEELEVRGREGL